MARLFDALIMFLQEEDIKFSQMSNDTSAMMTFNCDNGTYLCFARVREEQEQVIFYTVYPLRAPEERRQEVAEFVARVNYGIILGNLELDMRDGEVRYKCSADVSAAPFTLPLLRSVMQSCIGTADRYYPGFTALLYSGDSPAEAVARVEGPAETPPAQAPE